MSRAQPTRRTRFPPLEGLCRKIRRPRRSLGHDHGEFPDLAQDVHADIVAVPDEEEIGARPGDARVHDPELGHEGRQPRPVEPDLMLDPAHVHPHAGLQQQEYRAARPRLRAQATRYGTGLSPGS